MDYLLLPVGDAPESAKMRPLWRMDLRRLGRPNQPPAGPVRD